MKESRELWNRIVSDMEDAVSKAENELLVNQIFLDAARKQQRKFPEKPSENITG